MLELSRSERAAVVATQRATRDVRLWRRLQSVLLAAAGHGVPAIAAALGRGESTVFAWLAQWRAARDPARLADAPRSGQPPRLKAVHRHRLELLLACAPEAFGYRATGWTVPLLLAHFRTVERVTLGATTMRRTLHQLGYRWKRPRYVLARRDPERAEKKAGARGRGPARAAGGAAHGRAL